MSLFNQELLQANVFYSLGKQLRPFMTERMNEWCIMAYRQLWSFQAQTHEYSPK